MFVTAVMAGDTEPIEILLHLPLLAEDKVGPLMTLGTLSATLASSTYRRYRSQCIWQPLCRQRRT